MIGWLVGRSIGWLVGINSRKSLNQTDLDQYEHKCLTLVLSDLQWSRAGCSVNSVIPCAMIFCLLSFSILLSNSGGLSLLCLAGHVLSIWLKCILYVLNFISVRCHCLQDLKLIQKTRKTTSPLSPTALSLTGRKAVTMFDEGPHDDDEDGDEILEFERKIR